VVDRVTIILPVSRKEYIHQVFASLEMLECDRERTNLLVIVDGKPDLFVEARNFCEGSKFDQKLCLEFKSKHVLRHFDIPGRRMRISDIHNFAKQHIINCDYVFGVEDDTIIPPHALKNLKRTFGLNPFAGFVSGIELGRWGIPHVGAWRVDDVYQVDRIESIDVGEGIEEVDAGGFYCFITKADYYKNHDFKPFERNALGPDFDFGIELRRAGHVNLVDWSVQCTHKTKDQDIRVFNTEVRKVIFERNDTGRFRQTQSK